MLMREDEDIESFEDVDEEGSSAEEALGHAFEKLLEHAKERGFVTVEELNDTISAEQGAEAMEEAMAIMAANEINIVEKEELPSDSESDNVGEETEEEAAFYTEMKSTSTINIFCKNISSFFN